MIKAITKIRVTKDIKPIHRSKRKTPQLIIGNEYYVCFGRKIVYPCNLVEIINDFTETLVRIEIPTKPLSKKGYLNSKGEIRHDWKSPHILYSNEIGLTPEDAVLNCV